VAGGQNVQALQLGQEKGVALVVGVFEAAVLKGSVLGIDYFSVG
jgi:hypothetical protein